MMLMRNDVNKWYKQFQKMKIQIINIVEKNLKFNKQGKGKRLKIQTPK